MKEFENSLNIVNPSAIVIYSESKATAINTIIQEKKAADFKTEYDYIYYITHKVNNIKNKNGRIYLKIDDNGMLYANSISPYSEKYMDNIELKIKPLIEALYKKRYLTYSSCEGHGLSYRRYVGLAFANEDSREYVSKKIMGLKLPGVYVKKMDSVSNMLLEKDKKGYPVFANKKDLNKNNEEAIINEYREKEINTFNTQFHRNYENYVFLEIVILEEIPYNAKGIKWFFKKIYLTILKRFFWDLITTKIVKEINSNDFKKYHF